MMEVTVKSSYKQRTGHERFRFAHKNSNGFAIARQISALKRLQEQLVKGVKPIKNNNSTEALTEQDIKRIKKEIEILITKTR